VQSEESLVKQHYNLARGIANCYYLAGADADDVLQEALVALLIAIRSYRPAVGKFRPFARVVIHRRLASAIKTANAEKHKMLSRATRSGTNEEHERTQIVNLIPAKATLEETVLQRETLHSLAAVKLTPLERHCHQGWLAGLSYREIGQQKTVDNALFRAQQKFQAAA
jgi:RNA polymerase sporulation-specific sigma factor